MRRIFADKRDDANFGNARYARSVFEAAYANMAARALADGRIDPAELDDLEVTDVPAEDDRKFTEHRHIGFRAPLPGTHGTTAAEEPEAAAAEPETAAAAADPKVTPR